MILSTLQTDFFENIVETEKIGLVGNKKTELVNYDDNFKKELKKILSVMTSPVEKKNTINNLFAKYAFVLDKVELKDGILHFYFFDLKGRVEKEVELLRTIN